MKSVSTADQIIVDIHPPGTRKNLRVAQQWIADYFDLRTLPIRHKASIGGVLHVFQLARSDELHPHHVQIFMIKDLTDLVGRKNQIETLLEQSSQSSIFIVMDTQAIEAFFSEINDLSTLQERCKDLSSLIRAASKQGEETKDLQKLLDEASMALRVRQAYASLERWKKEGKVSWLPKDKTLFETQNGPLRKCLSQRRASILKARVVETKPESPSPLPPRSPLDKAKGFFNNLFSSHQEKGASTTQGPSGGRQAPQQPATPSPTSMTRSFSFSSDSSRVSSSTASSASGNNERPKLKK